MKTIQFKYKRSLQLISWGGSFDSLTELKFALSVMDDYHILRAPVLIYYHPGTLMPSAYVRRCHLRYTPDFLIRHKQTGEAILVEIKPRAFEPEPRLNRLKKVAENYIRWKHFDWRYQIIYDDQIILNQEQWEVFEDCIHLKSQKARNIWFKELSKKYDRVLPSLFKSAMSNAKVHLIMFGNKPG